MKSLKNYQVLPSLLMGLIFLFIASSCDKDNENENDNGQNGFDGFVTDIDGNVYRTVIIGRQEWMAENLRTTTYNDGTPIPRGQSDSLWITLTSGAYAIYTHSEIEGLNSDTEVLEAYGALYNWHAVETYKLCPTGWRVPSFYVSWFNLIDYVGGWTVAGNKLKSTRIVPDDHPRWFSLNTGATDEFGFSALPGGSTDSYGGFSGLGGRGHWWSSSEFDEQSVWYTTMSHGLQNVSYFYKYKHEGLSVRCMRVK
jgi:uncharacterized protein (TIGR02145 family)